MALLEVCCFRPESGILAGRSGADRIELCDKQHEGGTTPPQQWVADIKSVIDTPIFVMIRPRGGDFQYTCDEFEAMKRSIDGFKGSVDGYVFGILRDNLEVDVARTAELVERARPHDCTFHKAFDEALDLSKALEDVIATGCRGLLTSGGAPNALTGAQMLNGLVAAARGRITILVGGGVRLQNLAHIRDISKADAFHSSALVGSATLPDAADVRRMKQLLLGQPSAAVVARRGPDNCSTTVKGNGGSGRVCEAELKGKTYGWNDQGPKDDSPTSSRID